MQIFEVERIQVTKVVSFSVREGKTLKRILHISKYYYPFSGGTEQTARDCVIALKDSYEQKVIAFNDDNKPDERLTVDGIEVIKCGCVAKISSQSISLSYRSKLKSVLDEFHPDIIVFHYPNPFVAAILLREIKSNTKLVVYWHLDIIRQNILRKFFKGQNAKLLKRADMVIATSPNYVEGSEWLKSVKDKCVIIPSCINVERMKVTPEIEKRAIEIKSDNIGKIICIAVGRHTEYKGFTYLIQASKYLDTRFIIYITGKGELTEKLYKESAGDDKIVFTGRIEDMELKALILASEIFCFPSITKNEAFGLALAEGMYYEKPTVTFTIPGSGVNYVSLDGVTGIEVENCNAEKFAEAMKKLADCPELRQKYGMAGKKRVEGNFLSTQFKESIRNLFNEFN